MSKYELIVAPSDPYKPVGKMAQKRKHFKVGDVVVTPEGYIGTIIDIEKGYRDRGDNWVKRNLYRLDMPQVPGSPRVCYCGWELEKYTKGVHSDR